MYDYIESNTLNSIGSVLKGFKPCKSGSSSPNLDYSFSCNNCEIKIDAEFFDLYDSIYKGQRNCPFCKSPKIHDVKYISICGGHHVKKTQNANRGESALTALNTLRCVISKALKVVKVGGVGSGK